jgi:RNA polymerase sigma-70 factor (ECF subfamily)
MYDSRIVSTKDGEVMIDSDIISRFNEIYDSTNKYILTYITSKCGNSSDISDIFQETYIELYQLMSKRGVEYITNEKALVLKIAKRKIARYYSLAERLRKFVSMTGKSQESDSREIELSDEEANSFLMEESVINQIILEEARKFIQQKPADIEKIFYLFYDVGLTIPEIAESLSINESGVKNKLYRTIKELKNILAKGGY